MKLSSIVVLLLFVLFPISSAMDKYDEMTTTTNDEANDMFMSWLVKHGKIYDTVEEKGKRFQIFKDNLEYIEQHNSGGHSYKLGLNKFADLSLEEYRLLYTMPKKINSKRKLNNVKSDRYFVRSGDVLPDSIDWRTKGAIGAVKDQGRCGCCWAFSSVGAVEAINQIVTSDLITLSEQELVDCDTSYSQGCNGGYTNDAFEFIVRNGGIDSDIDYPYIGMDGICNNNKKSKKRGSIDGYEHVPMNNESALQIAVVNQPVSVSIDSNSRDFQLYASGIYNGSCGIELDHAVVLGGYGTEDGKEYWIVRNSWGVEWGEQGYIRMERNIKDEEGQCGIAMHALYPIKNGYSIKNGLNLPKEATVFVPFLFLFLLEVSLSFI
ncbi:putative actinidain [Helianthus annuus]|uniref:Actinidain n=1 Tax=Helianthus annuus TaxID=4232 RepID=A0A251TIQ3_HELAN|nr:zingipain-2 [Helianthus annuus]KAF5817528.1 putative actinidain [Helianthus annuus]KAJ0776451.1 putative actinidain [Helianthus annuus]KAJ0938939.1 putative actinidain [Helianthus annuus]